MNCRSLVMCIAFFHLTIVFLSAFYLSWNGRGPLDKILNYYGTLTGATYRYGFFTPRVSNQARIVFDLYSGSTKLESVDFTDTVLYGEAKIRLGNVLTTFFHESVTAKTDSVSDFQKTVLQHLGNRALARFVSASKISLRLERFKPVSIEQFNQGVRPEWTLIQKFDFERPPEAVPHG